MQRVNIGLVCLSWLVLASAVSAQTAVDTYSEPGIAEVQNFSGGGVLQGTYFDIRHMTGDGVGYRDSYSQIGVFTPIWMNEDSFIAPNARLIITNSTQIGVNAGLVGRKYVESLDRIFGVYGYYDDDQNYLNNRYSQFNLGAETMGEWWDLRGNGYFLNGSNDNFVQALGISGNPYFVGNSLAFNGLSLRDQSMGGGDMEFGVPVSASTQWLRAYSGFYAYRTSEQNTFGYRGRIEAMVSNDLTLGVVINQDRLWGTNLNATIDFRFSGFQPTRYFPNLTTRERMLNPVQRNWRVATHTYNQRVDIAAINPETNRPYFITHVDNSNPGDGNGTFQNPFKKLPGSAPGDIILVHNGNSSEGTPVAGSIVLSDDQRLLGEGRLSTVDLYARYGNTIFGNFDLPGTSNSGIYPYLRNDNAALNGGSVVTLANNNEVRALNLIGSKGDAIRNTSAGSRNFLLHNLEISGNDGRGIALMNASGGGIIRDINVGTTNHANPMGFGQNKLGGIQIDTAVPGLDLFMSNVYMNADAAKPQAFGVKLYADDSYLNVSMNNVFTNNNGTGIELRETSQQLSAYMNLVRSNNNNGVGIRVDGTDGSIAIVGQNVAAMSNKSNNLQITTQATPNETSRVGVVFTDSNFSNSTGGSGVVFSQSGGAGTLNLTNTNVTGNVVDGLGIYATNSTLMNANIRDGQFQNNLRDAFHVAGASESTVNLFVDPTNASGSGRDALYYKMDDALLNVAFLDNDLNNSGRSAVHGELSNTAVVNLYFDNNTARNSGGDGFYLNTSGGSFANMEFSHGTLANSGRLVGGSSAFNIISNNSTVSLLSNMTPANNLTSDGLIGNQAYGLKLDLKNASRFIGDIYNSDLSDVRVSAIRVDATTGSDAALTLINTSGNRSLFHGIDANLNYSTLVTDFRNSNFNNSGRDGMNFNVANGGILSSRFDNSSFNNSGQNGIYGELSGANSIASIALVNGSTINNSGVNGLEYFLDDGEFNFATFSSSISNSGQGGVRGSGVRGNVKNGGVNRLNFNNTAIDNNLDNGVLVTSRTDSIIQASVNLGSVSNNGISEMTPRGNDGIRLDIERSPFSFLQVYNGATVSGNGNDGISIRAAQGTNFVGAFGTDIYGRAGDTGITVVDNGVAPPPFGNTRTGLEVIATSNSLVDLSLNAVTLGNTFQFGPQQIGMNLFAGSNSRIDASLVSSDLSNNSSNAINTTVTGAGSQINLDLANVQGDRSGAIGALFNVLGGGELNVTSTVNTSFSQNGGAGMFVRADGVNSIANLDLESTNLDANGTFFGGQGFFGVASNGGNLNAAILTSSISSNANQGIQLTTNNPNSLTRFNVAGSTLDFNGSEGLLVNVGDQGTVYYRSIGNTYSANGTNGSLDGVNVTATGTGPADSATAILLFSGDNVDFNAGDGFSLTALDGATLTTSIENGTSGSNNGGFGIRGAAAGTNTKFNLLMSSDNTFEDNVQGPISPLVFADMDQVVLNLSGSFNDSLADGIRIDLQNIVNAVVAIQGPGTINESTQNGINVSLTDVINGSVLVNGVTSVNNSGANGIRVAFDNVSNGAIALQGPTTVNGSGANGIDLQIVDSTLVDGITFGAASIDVLTLADSLPTPLDFRLPVPVNVTIDNTGLTPTQALSVSGMTVNTAANTGMNILATNSSIQTISVTNNIVVTSLGTAANTGDGIHFDLTSTPIDTLNLIGNQIGGARLNGVNFDLDAAPIGAVNIVNNSIGTIASGGGSAVGDTLPIILPGFNANTLPANDDASTDLVALGFDVDFFGTVYDGAYVNNNGNITFDQPLGAFTPFSLLTTATPIIAPFFADVDTRTGNEVTYGTGTVDGRAAFGVNWLDVRHFSAAGGGDEGLPPNTFQLVLIDRSDIAPGDFDFEFNYQSILWESGEASGGDDAGLGGSSARAGYSNGIDASFELAGSAVNGAFLDGGPIETSLIRNSLNSVNDGRYIFFVRGGLVGGPSPNQLDGIRLNATNGSSIGALTVNNNEIANSGANGINLLISDSDVSNQTFANNIIQDNGGDGIRMVNPTTGTDTITAVFQDNQVTNNTGTGVNLILVNGTQNLNASFGSNTISSNAGGPGINVQLADNRNYLGGFDFNTISNNGAQGINMQMGVNGQITSNFTDNNINGNTNEGINIALSTGGHFESAQFYGNQIGTLDERNGGMGVRLVVPDQASFNWNLGDTTRDANLIIGNSDAGVGILMTGASTGVLNVANSEFSDTLNGPDANFNGDGLRSFQQGSSTLTGSIIQSTFTNNVGSGAQMTVTGNNLGVFASLNDFTVGGATQALGNIFNNNGANGLEFSRTADGQINNMTIQNSEFRGNTQNGLAILAANEFRTDTYTINDNQFVSNDLNGVLFDERADANIRADMSGNTITNNGTNGIQLIEQFNNASDLRSLSGTWSENLIANNTQDGIALNGVTSGLLITQNQITLNQQNGIEVTSAGDLIIDTNEITFNGTLANLNTAAENAGILMSVNSTQNIFPTSNITVSNNVIDNNFGDGVQYQISTGTNGATAVVSVEGNEITNNHGRGVNLINRGFNTTIANISDNYVAANRLEGVYIVNTASTSQAIWAPSTTPLVADGSVFASPILNLTMDGNTIIGNGLNSGLTGTGLIIRVGTSDGGFGPSFPGGFASDGFGGVVARVDNNFLGGNFGDDVLFNSFVSTGTPAASGGTWSTTEYTVTAYQSDPLSRFDLTYRNNTTDPGSFDQFGTSLGGFASRDQALVAFYNNAEGVFKSRLNTADPAGPFNVDVRARNATRLAARIPNFLAPQVVVNPTPPPPTLPAPGLSQLYPGLGQSVWRVSADSDGGFVRDDVPYINTGSANGFFLNGIGANGELPYGWGTF